VNARATRHRLNGHPSADLLVDALRPLIAELLEPLERRLDDLERQLNGGERRWITLEEAARRLDCSPNAVRMRVSRGRLEARHQGRRLYVSADSVDNL
jgi:Helix-turn-helix domain